MRLQSFKTLLSKLKWKVSVGDPICSYEPLSSACKSFSGTNLRSTRKDALICALQGWYLHKTLSLCSLITEDVDYLFCCKAGCLSSDKDGWRATKVDLIWVTEKNLASINIHWKRQWLESHYSLHWDLFYIRNLTLIQSSLPALTGGGSLTRTYTILNQNFALLAYGN